LGSTGRGGDVPHQKGVVSGKSKTFGIGKRKTLKKEEKKKKKKKKVTAKGGGGGNKS